MAEVHTCQNMVKTLSQAVADGWEVLGAVAEPKAIECRKFRLERPTIIVMGKDLFFAMKRGVRPQVHLHPPPFQATRA